MATALEIAETHARRHPGNSDWQRHLSVSFEEIGVQKAQGDLTSALKSYRDDLAIAERLAKSGPGNSGWQRDLSVSYDRVGDVQKAQDDLAGALKSYSDSLGIKERLAQFGPGNAGRQHDLSLSYDRIGDVQKAQGDLAGAPIRIASPSESSWLNPAPATRAGSAICRCRSKRSATCRLRKTTLPVR
jgi:tetratricopeptide (TPR) repeat protein